MRKHDRVLAYGQSYEESNKPLILVVGREPSMDADEITDSMGSYNFDDVRSTSFWNVAHRYLAGAAGLDSKALKQRCRDSKRSPLVIGDALPIAVRNGNSKVSDLRGAVCRNDIDHHVARTLVLSKAAERVKLIVLAGHRTGARGTKPARENLTHANTSYHRQASELNSNILVIDIPFLTDQNSKSLKHALSDSGTPELLKHIFTDFFDISGK